MNAPVFDLPRRKAPAILWRAKSGRLTTQVLPPEFRAIVKNLLAIDDGPMLDAGPPARRAFCGFNGGDTEALTPLDLFMLWIALDLVRVGYEPKESVVQTRALRIQCAEPLDRILKGRGTERDGELVLAFGPPGSLLWPVRTSLPQPAITSVNDAPRLIGDAASDYFVFIPIGPIASQVSVRLLYAIDDARGD